jgi:glycosidase
MKKIISSCIVLLFAIQLVAQQTDERIYPSHWWAGMKNPNVQVMVYSKGISNRIPMFKLPATGTKVADGIIMKMVHRVDNPNYVFLDLVIDKNAKPGMRKITFPTPGSSVTFEFEIKARRAGKGSSFAQGVDSKDLVYLLMPDRFSNGDPSNDKVPGMRDQSLNRDSISDRHGGDLQGVINHLDYLKDLGVTSVWMTPVIENDMPNRTEHGYAFTNHYRVDPRLGGDDMYKKLSDELHKRKMKLIQDAVYNHVGSYHFTVLDPPSKDWLHEWPSFTQTTYKDQVLFDPHASALDKKKMSDGWFVKPMPDLNQNNPYVANFLIQHAIWSVEEFGVDGWRIDTYAYNDLEFMNRCNKALRDEYPKITMFGETWVHGVPNQSYFCENNYTNIPFKSNLWATTDFQLLFYGIQATLNENFGWTEGVNKMYTTTAQDFVYKDPMRQVIFFSNHDLPRFYSVIKEDLAKYKIALSWLMTFRGVPQLYYGDEILMTGMTNPDGWVRLDFKGGWKEDTVNKFTAAGRAAKENEAFNHLRTLARYRQTSSAITTGKLMQFTPDDAVYVYFRYDNKQTIMCVMNTDEKSKTIKLDRFAERTNGFTKSTDILSGTTANLGASLTIEGRSMLVMELKK